MIACGQNHSLFIDTEGLVWASGYNGKGQLGIGSFQDQNTFCQIQGISSAVQVSAAVNGYHSAILDHQGTVYMFGSNQKSQTGSDEEQTTIASPTIVRDLPQIIMVSCGFQHSIVLDTNACLWGVGSNERGQLSSKGAILRKFTQITSNTTDPMGKVTKISCGYFHSMCQSETGELWGTGFNENGELGVGHNQNVNWFQKVVLDEDILVQSFYCGIYFSVMLDMDGAVWATGYGCHGQLGSGNTADKNKLTKMLNIPPMAQIVCGGWSVIMTDRNGKVYACGDNQQAQLGMGHNGVFLSPEAVPDLPSIVQGCISLYFALVVDEEGGVWASGSNRYGQHGNNYCSKGTDRFVRVEGVRVNTVNEKRFFSTKRAHHTE